MLEVLSGLADDTELTNVVRRNAPNWLFEDADMEALMRGGLSAERLEQLDGKRATFH